MCNVQFDLTEVFESKFMPNSFFIILCACAGTGETNSAKVPSTFLNVTIKDSNLSRHVDKVMKTTSKIGDVTSCNL